MAIQDELSKLNTTKQGIKAVLEEKGVDLTGKTFSDTPGLIETMSVGKGDEVEAYPIGEAKKAQANDKVILNFAADMMPGEGSVDLAGKDIDYKSAFITYIDKEYLYGGMVWGTGGMIACFRRENDGVYSYKGYPSPYPDFDDSFGFAHPYGVIYSGWNVLLMSGTIVHSYQGSGGSFTNKYTYSYSPDYKFSASINGNGVSIYRLDNGKYAFMRLDTSFSGNREGGGIVKRNEKYYLIVFNNSSVCTYLIDKLTGSLSLVGSKVPIYYPSTGHLQQWKFLPNNKAICLNTAGAENASISDVEVIEYSFDENGLCDVVKDNNLTGLLQSYMMSASTGNFHNCMIIDGKDIYIWGYKGIVALRYENGTFTPIATPFPDVGWSSNFFLNPVDKIAVLILGEEDQEPTYYIRHLDAPVTQKYIATKAGDGLQFQSVSLTGFVKENNNGVLKVSTVLDPNAVVPSYPDTYGLNVTVRAGAANTEVTVPYGTGQSISNAGNITSFGFLPKEPTHFSKIQIQGRSSGSSNTTEKYLKLFVWDEAQSLYTFVTCSTNTQQLDTNTTAVWEFAREVTLNQNTYYRFVFSSDNTSAWSGLVGTSAKTQDAESSTDYKLMCSTSTSNPPSTSTYAFIPVFSFIYYGTDEGKADISWGWFKSGEEYVKWDGALSATLANVEGEKATTMGLWLVKDGETVKPVISIAEPLNYTIRHQLTDVYLNSTHEYFIKIKEGLEYSVLAGNLTAVGLLGEVKLAANGDLTGFQHSPISCGVLKEKWPEEYNNFEIIIPFTTPLSITNEPCILGRDDTRNISLSVVGQKIELKYCTSGDTYFATHTTSDNLLPATKYWIKAKWTGTQYISSISTDGTVYTQFGLTDSSLKLQGGVFNYLGTFKGGSANNYFTGGTIHTGEMSFIFDDEKYFIQNGYIVPVAGKISITAGYYTSPSDKIVSYNGGTATFDNIVGNKALTMNLYMCETQSGGGVPVISISEPSNYTSYILIGTVYLSHSLDYFIDSPALESAGV